MVMITSRNHKCVPQLWGIKREVPASGMKGSRSSVIVITSFGAQLFQELSVGYIYRVRKVRENFRMT